MLSLRTEERIRARRFDLGQRATSSEDSRRRRAGESLQLRKDAREEVIAKRRREITPETGIGAAEAENIAQRVRFDCLPFNSRRLRLYLA